MPRLLGIKQLMEYINVGRNTARRVGIEAEATVRIGGRVLYDRLKIDEWIERTGGKHD